VSVWKIAAGVCLGMVAFAVLSAMAAWLLLLIGLLGAGAAGIPGP